MKRFLLPAALVLLALPGSALAAARGGVVLSADRAHHVVRVVDAKHVVHAYRYRGRLPKVQPGSRLTYEQSGRTISHLKATPSKASTVSFYARVRRSSARGIVLRLADGSDVNFSPRQVSRAPSAAVSSRRHRPALAHIAASPRAVTVAILGLESGVTVLVTETVDGSGGLTITITLPAASAAGVGGSQQADGVVGDVSGDAVLLDTSDGLELRLHVRQSTLASLNLQACDAVSVTYHQDAGILIAENVQRTGRSSTGSCAGEQPSQDLSGTITQISGSGLTVSTDQGPRSFTVPSADITDGFAVGDVVDVTYSQSAASDVEYVERDAGGTVTAVDAASLTITDGTGQSTTFVADPTQSMFDGIVPGDQVNVTYHQSSGHKVVDVAAAGS
jgi:hypothetical protein